MARQLDKRAKQLSEEKKQPYEESLAHLVALMRQGWAGQARDAASGAVPRWGSIQKWEIIERHAEDDMRIFRSQWRVSVSPRTKDKHKVLVLRGNDWVNVVALTPRREVVLIEQYRHGIDEVTLEIPGGLINQEERPEVGGVRELREETGYGSGMVERLGTVHPNPAFQSNICHSILVRDAVKVGEPELDHGEDIAVHLVPLTEINNLIRHGRITHSLVIVAFHWMHLRGEM